MPSVKSPIRLVVRLLAILAVLPLSAQSGLTPGEWRAYLSHNRAFRSVATSEAIYTITSGGLTRFDLATEALSTYSTVEGLSGVDPTTIYFDANSGRVFIGYTDGTVDFFREPGDLDRITDIRRNDFFTQKRITALHSDAENLYVATEFGLVVYDLATLLPRSTVTQVGDNPSRQPVEGVSTFQNRVWVALGDLGLYSAAEDAFNLSDPSSWRREDGSNDLPETSALQVAEASNVLYLRTDTTVWRLKSEGGWGIAAILDRPLRDISAHDEFLVASEGVEVIILRDDAVTDIFSTDFLVEHAVPQGEYVYLDNSATGLQRRNRNTGEVIQLVPGGPKSNNVTDLAAADGRLYVAPQGYENAYNPLLNFEGISYYNPDGGWQTLAAGDPLPEDRTSISFARAFYDVNTRQAWLGSWGQGLVALRDSEVVATYDCQNANLSIIDAPCNPTDLVNTRVSGIDRDPDGQIWVTVALAREPLMVLQEDGQFLGIPANRLPGEHFYIDLLVDDFGNKWMIDRNNGLVVFNENGTLDDFSDDVVLQFKQGSNREGLTTDRIFSLAKDQDGFIWVGTEQGVRVFYDPFSVSQGQQIEASCPVIDGRCLLQREKVNTITVDGGNRKWIGTESGVFLVSAEGDEVLANFTTENSPIYDNSIRAISVDGQTGEVFIGTSRGLISYQGDATEGAAECDEVVVFPNPVEIDFQGNITIRGSATGSTVRITTVSGFLVREIVAQGGTALWDGRDAYGQRVRPGVYLALIAQENGEQGCIGKFSVLGWR